MDDRLLDRLAQEGAVAPVRKRLARDVRGMQLTFGAALVLVLAWLGVREDIGTAIATPVFWIKLGFPMLLALVVGRALVASLQPGRRFIDALAGAAALYFCFLLLAVAVSSAWRTDLFGSTWKECPIYVTAIAIPLMLPTMVWLRRYGPVHPRWTGALAGLACGLVGAVLYAIHCKEPGLLFLAVWYVLGALVPGVVGALVGRRVLAW